LEVICYPISILLENFLKTSIRFDLGDVHRPASIHFELTRIGQIQFAEGVI
jgi:hypothetical protein